MRLLRDFSVSTLLNPCFACWRFPVWHHTKQEVFIRLRCSKRRRWNKWDNCFSALAGDQDKIGWLSIWPALSTRAGRLLHVHRCVAPAALSAEPVYRSPKPIDDLSKAHTKDFCSSLFAISVCLSGRVCSDSIYIDIKKHGSLYYL